MARVYVYDETLLEINERDEMVKSDINVPPESSLFVSQYSGRIAALQRLNIDVHLYELIDRSFVLIQTINDYFATWPNVIGFINYITLYGNFLVTRLGTGGVISYSLRP